jgi:hypothetical protein
MVKPASAGIGIWNLDVNNATSACRSIVNLVALPGRNVHSDEAILGVDYLRQHHDKRIQHFPWNMEHHHWTAVFVLRLASAISMVKCNNYSLSSLVILGLLCKEQLHCGFGL